MIAEIKAYLKGVLQDITGIGDDYCYLTAQDETAYKTAPWISILSIDASINPDTYSDVQKNRISQSIKVGIAGKNEASVSAWMDTFINTVKPRLFLPFDGKKVDVMVYLDKLAHSDSISVLSDEAISTIEITFAFYILKKMV